MLEAAVSAALRMLWDASASFGTPPAPRQHSGDSLPCGARGGIRLIQTYIVASKDEQRRIYASEGGEDIPRYPGSPQRQASPFPMESTNRRYYRRNRNSKGEEVFAGENTAGSTLARRGRRDEYAHDGGGARAGRLCINGPAAAAAGAGGGCDSPPEPAPPEVPPRGPSLHVALRHRPNLPIENAATENDRHYISEELYVHLYVIFGNLDYRSAFMEHVAALRASPDPFSTTKNVSICNMCSPPACRSLARSASSAPSAGPARTGQDSRLTSAPVYDFCRCRRFYIFLVNSIRYDGVVCFHERRLLNLISAGARGRTRRFDVADTPAPYPAAPSPVSPPARAATPDPYLTPLKWRALTAKLSA
ncbi:hypothetical protein EVAR_36852_1 [Eumeta japonica]|uniref:Uncharacterized protein n=1 Tax=Eumeta variegata TaxID=151549 RepID=A0A4C1WUR9_EUMVA|nr:hypothetical protein EVAR_36852_1 [Eumeta japonica]